MRLPSLQKKIIFFMIISLASGCASKTWVIQRDQYGGVIGYKGFNSSQAADKAIKDIIPCPSFRMIKDELHLSQSTALLPFPTSQTSNGIAYNSYGESINYQSTSSGTQYIPMPVDNSYRTFTYVCENSTTSKSPSLSTEEDKILYQNLDLTIQPRIGTLNVQKVLIQCDAGKKGMELLRTTFNKEQDTLKKEEAEIKKLQSSFNKNKSSYSNAVKQEKQMEIEDRINDVQKLTKQKQDSIQELELRVKAPILTLIKLSVDEIASKKGYTIIQESEIESSDDLTELITQEVNKKSEKNN